jgi:hypothetical protein
MSRYRDSGSSDCKLYVGDLGKRVNNCTFRMLVLFGFCYSKCVNVLLMAWLAMAVLGRALARGALVDRRSIKNFVDSNLSLHGVMNIKCTN